MVFPTTIRQSGQGRPRAVSGGQGSHYSPCRLHDFLVALCERDPGRGTATAQATKPDPGVHSVDAPKRNWSSFPPNWFGIAASSWLVNAVETLSWSPAIPGSVRLTVGFRGYAGGACCMRSCPKRSNCTYFYGRFQNHAHNRSRRGRPSALALTPDAPITLAASRHVITA